MIVLSSLLRRVVYPALSGANLFSRRFRAGEVAVLTYHGVLPEGVRAGTSPAEGALVSAAQFRQELRFLKSRYELITPDAFRGWIRSGGLPPRGVLLTCDDGLGSVLTEMVPILAEEDVRCLFFVTGASLSDAPASLWYEELYCMLDLAPGAVMLRVGEKHVRKDSLAKKQLDAYWWNRVQELSSLNWDERSVTLAALREEWRGGATGRADDRRDGYAQRHRLLTRSELLQLAAHGMTVGAHTMTHPLLARMPGEHAEWEIRECRRQMEAALQCDVWALAYPFGNEGSAGSRERKMAEASGYECAFMNCGSGLVQQTGPRFAFPRTHVTAEMSLAELEAHLSGFHEKLRSRFHRESSAGQTESGSRPCA